MQTEGIVQYRLLGSHPAASGRYLTVGFPGDSILVEKLLQQVVCEHQINLSKYKLDVTRVSRPAAGGTQHDEATPNQTEETLHPQMALHTYDRIVVNVAKRQLADDTSRSAQLRQQEENRRLQEAELHLLSPSVADSKHTRVASAAARRVPRDAKVVDPSALQRAAAVAQQSFPVRRGMHNAIGSVSDAKNDHICVLCMLGAFDEVLTPCCHFPCCSMCLLSAETMVATENECPVCGVVKVDEEASAKGTDVTLDERKLKLQSFTSGHSYKPEGKLPRGSKEDSAIRIRRRGEEGVNETRFSSDVERFERELLDNLDKALSLLDVPDPLSAAEKAKRCVSAALQALDAQIVR